ncbi:ABC-type multidrug transport system, ATPase component, partial [mine drainage metagenome]
KALSNVGSVVESPKPYSAFTVRDAIEMVGEFRGLSPETIRDRFDSLNEVLELPSPDRYMYALSKGLRQRVTLAGAIIADPAVILLDEPTSGLDPAERVRVRMLIQRLKKNHLILMSSHLLGEVSETCDDVVFLNHGKVLRQSRVSEFAAWRNSGRVEVEFLNAVNPGQLQAIVS